MSLFDRDSLRNFSGAVATIGAAAFIAGFVNSIEGLKWVGGPMCLVGLIALLVFVFRPKKPDLPKEMNIMGDQFNNNGSNFGHMGNITNNFRPAPRSFDGEENKQFLRVNLDRSKEVIITSPMGDNEAASLANQINIFLNGEGYTSKTRMAMYSGPAPTGLQFHKEKNEIIVGTQ